MKNNYSNHIRFIIVGVSYERRAIFVTSNDDYSTLCGALKDNDLADALSGGEFTLHICT